MANLLRLLFGIFVGVAVYLPAATLCHLLGIDIASHQFGFAVPLALSILVALGMLRRSAS